MAFWGTEVKPGNPYTHSPINGRLRLSQATLGIGMGSESASESQKTIVQCNVGNKTPVFLCCLFPDRLECCQLDLEFEESDEVVFSVMGPQSVHLSGYFISLNHHNAVDDDDDDDKTESYGEDIGESDTERSENSEESDYGGSFINDDPLILPSSPEYVEEKSRMDNETEDNDIMLDGTNAATAVQPEMNEEEHEHVHGVDNALMRLKESEELPKEERFPEADHDLNEKPVLEHNEPTSNKNEEEQDHVHGVDNALMRIKESEELPKEERFPEADHDLNEKPVLEHNEPTSNKNGEEQEHVHGVDNALIQNKESEELPKEERFPEADHHLIGKPVLEQNELASNENEEKQEHVHGVDNALMEIEESEELPKEERFPEADHDLIGKPVLEQNELASYKECKHNDLLKTASQIGHKDGGKLKRKRKHVKEKILKENTSKDDDGQKSEPNFDSINDLEEKETQMQINDKKRKKKKMCKNKVDWDAMKMELYVLSANEKNGSVVEMESKNVDEQKTQLSNAIIIEELEVGKPDGKITFLGKKAVKILKDNASYKDEGQKSESDFDSVTDLEEKETQMQINDEKRKKKKRCKNKVDGGAMKMEPHVLSANEKNGSVVEMDRKNACESKSHLSNGIIIEELEVGKPKGKIASVGKKVYVRYSTTLKEGDQEIDSYASKEVFKFRLGGENTQELWNVGLDGMVVGGKRRLTIPPSVTESSRNEEGTGLFAVFDVELVKIK